LRLELRTPQRIVAIRCSPYLIDHPRIQLVAKQFPVSGLSCLLIKTQTFVERLLRQ